LNRRPRLSSPGTGASGIKDMGEVMAALRHRHAGSWISPAPVRLSDGSRAEPETDCEEISLTVSHLYVNSISSYGGVARHGVSSRGFFVSLVAKGPGSLRMAILGVQDHWLIDNYVRL
jgi:hypothetical protein